MIARRPIALIATVLYICLLQSYCFAQDKSKVQFGKVSPADFDLPANPIIDTNANAVIIADIGSVHFVGNNYNWFSYVFKKQTRIKILNKKAFDLATHSVFLYGPDERPEKLTDVVASTYNLENGQVIATHLNKQDVYTTRLDKDYFEKKFTLPGVKEGSIIEYSYTITSPYDSNLPSWKFQSESYPCLWSEYQVSIPQALFYVVVRQGVHGYAIDKGSEGNESYKVSEKADMSVALGDQGRDLTVSARTTKHQWVMKDIPAFRIEHYLSTPGNYIDKLEFQLSKIHNGQEFFDRTNNWGKATEELLQREDFCGTLADDNDWLKDLVDKAAANNSAALEQAKSIYYYVSDHFTCTDEYNKYLTTTLRGVVKKNSGSVGDINLLLIAMLRKKGWQADPVVLSTREFGYNLVSYPVLGKLNYVIARLKLDGKIWYLDAAKPHLGFGRLAGNCYNGHARIISNKDSASIYFEADSLKEKKTTLVLLSSTDKGLEGVYQSTLGDQESYNLRRWITEKGEKEYFKRIQTGYGDDLTISNGDIDSLSQPENPTKVHYEFRLSQEPGAPLIYINPMWWSDTRDNPFKAADRKYPVEMPYVMDDAYIYSMEIPEGYVVDELPKSTKVSLNGDQGLFEYLLEQQGNMIQLRCRIRLNKAWFSAEDYSSLRDFYAYVVKKESEQIVLKKK